MCGAWIDCWRRIGSRAGLDAMRHRSYWRPARLFSPLLFLWLASACIHACAAQVEAPNGIACDSRNDRLFVTGKLWPWIYQVKVVAKADP